MDASTRLWQLQQEVRARLREEAPAASVWGAIPVVSVFAAVGLVFISLADTLARFGWPFPDVPFWLGIALVVVPVALRLLSGTAERGERVGLVVLLAVATYVIKVLHSPSYFTLFDELLHVRTAEDITRTGQLFTHNPLLVVSPLFPGLELVTNAISQLTGASTFDAGLAVIGLARILLVLALFLLFEEVSGSARIAGVAAFLYATNPSFVFFDAQFAYESLALPLAVLAIFSAIRWQRNPSSVPFAILTLVSILATVVTHHLTSYVLLAFIALWGLATVVVGGRRASRVPAIALGFGLVAVVVWTVVFAPPAIGYMAPHLTNALDLIKLILGQSEARTLFETGTGTAAPPWERLAAIVTTGLTLLIVLAGLVITWRHHRRDAAVVALALGAIGYPLSLGLRLTETGAEEASRVPEFVFLGVALLGGLVVERLLEGGIVDRLLAQVPSRESLRNGILGAGAAVVFIGGMIIGVPRWSRLPGPYLPAADPRSIDPQGRAAASWSLDFLGPGVRIATDRINRVLMGSEGLQYPVTAYGDSVASWRLFFTPTVDATDRQIIKAGQISVLVTDQRLTTSLPLTRVYFENGEPHMFDRKTPLDPANLSKWNTVTGVSRFYDSGDIRMYDVRSLGGS